METVKRWIVIISYQFPLISWTQIRSYSSKNKYECFVVHILDPSHSMDEFLHAENANLVLKKICAQQDC